MIKVGDIVRITEAPSYSLLAGTVVTVTGIGAIHPENRTSFHPKSAVWAKWGTGDEHSTYIDGSDSSYKIEVIGISVDRLEALRKALTYYAQGNTDHGRIAWDAIEVDDLAARL